MFKTVREQHQSTHKGDSTRDHILEVALRLFRKRGIDGTTMRDIARAAKVSLGAAYYYFPSKEALVHAFYDRVQQVHRTRVEASCACSGDLQERVREALLGKLEVLQDERALLGALFRFAGDADHPLSVFGEATRVQREEAIASFALTLEGTSLDPALRDAAARGLWLAHLGLILHFIHDPSPGQQRTRKLAATIAELFCSAVRLAALPGASALLQPFLTALVESDLIPAPGSAARSPEVSP